MTALAVMSHVTNAGFLPWPKGSGAVSKVIKLLFEKLILGTCSSEFFLSAS